MTALMLVVDDTGTPATRMAPRASVTDLAEECPLMCKIKGLRSEVTAQSHRAVECLIQHNLRADWIRIQASKEVLRTQ